VEEFAADMDDMLGALQDMPTADGHERVYTAGQPEAEMERHRRVTGIPIAPALAQQCNDVASSLGVKPLS
jgi:LDH2 family malate/lactate/ureidoglycolate dehydrogenase